MKVRTIIFFITDVSSELMLPDLLTGSPGLHINLILHHSGDSGGDEFVRLGPEWQGLPHWWMPTCPEPPGTFCTPSLLDTLSESP